MVLGQNTFLIWCHRESNELSRPLRWPWKCLLTVPRVKTSTKNSIKFLCIIIWINLLENLPLCFIRPSSVLAVICRGVHTHLV